MPQVGQFRGNGMFTIMGARKKDPGYQIFLEENKVMTTGHLFTPEFNHPGYNGKKVGLLTT
jgi:hypothetical protein